MISFYTKVKLFDYPRNSIIQNSALLLVRIIEVLLRTRIEMVTFVKSSVKAAKCFW